MLRNTAMGKIAVAGATAAVIIGAGTAALAASGSTTPGHPASGNQASGNHASGKQHAHRKAMRAALRRSLHADITTKGKDGYVTRSAIRGTVTSVSATSLAVRAADGFTESFTLTKDTKVRKRTAGQAKGAAATAAILKSGDSVAVLGRGADKAGVTPTATLVVDGVKK